MERMGLAARVFTVFIANAFGLLAATSLFPDFQLEGAFVDVMWLSLIFTGLNVVLKPVLKLILGPFIVLTLGFGLIVVNALMLYILDILSENLSIQGIPALIYATLLMSLVNFVVHLAIKK